MSRPLVHLGLPKTGTTTIQQVISHLPGVMSIGKPFNFDLSSDSVFHQRDVDRLVWGCEREARVSIRKLQRLREIAELQGSTLVLSDESLSQVNIPFSLHERLAVRLVEALPDSHIVLGLRDQRSLVQAIYAQSDRMMYAALGWPRDVPKQFVFRRLSFDKWVHTLFEHHRRTIVDVLHYPQLLDVYVGRFGSERVHALPLEELSAQSLWTIFESTGLRVPTPTELPDLNRTDRKMNPYRGGWFPQKLLEPSGWLRRNASERTWRAYARAGNAIVRVFGEVKMLQAGSSSDRLFEEFIDSNRELRDRYSIGLYA